MDETTSGKLLRCTNRNGAIVDFYLYVAAAIVTVRRLIQRARSLYRWDTPHPPPQMIQSPEHLGRKDVAQRQDAEGNLCAASTLQPRPTISSSTFGASVAIRLPIAVTAIEPNSERRRPRMSL